MKPHPYLIIVAGRLRASDREWLADLAVSALHEKLSVLTGVLDQAALFGVFRRLQYLALDIGEVHRLCACLAPQPARVAVSVR